MIKTGSAGFTGSNSSDPSFFGSSAGLSSIVNTGLFERPKLGTFAPNGRSVLESSSFLPEMLSRL